VAGGACVNDHVSVGLRLGLGRLLTGTAHSHPSLHGAPSSSSLGRTSSTSSLHRTTSSTTSTFSSKAVRAERAARVARAASFCFGGGEKKARRREETEEKRPSWEGAMVVVKGVLKIVLSCL
jgi:hypothetical protein